MIIIYLHKTCHKQLQKRLQTLFNICEENDGSNPSQQLDFSLFWYNISNV